MTGPHRPQKPRPSSSRSCRPIEDQGRRVSPNSGTNYAPTVFETKTMRKASRKAFARAMTRLLKANRIHIERIGPPSRQRDQLRPGPPPAKEGEEEAPCPERDGS